MKTWIFGDHSFLFYATGLIVWVSIGVTLAMGILRLLWEALGTTIFLVRVCRSVDRDSIVYRRLWLTWWAFFTSSRTSIHFPKGGKIVRWPRPWYDAEADSYKSWNQPRPYDFQED